MFSLVKQKRSAKCVLAVLLVFGTIFSLYFSRTQPWLAKMLEEEKYEEPGPYHVAYPRNYRFILDQMDKCNNPKLFVVVMVPVAPHHVEERYAIRSTWGNDTLVQEGVVLVLFLLGVPSGIVSRSQKIRLYQENLQHGDLLQSDFVDSYRNLTIKTMMMLEWLKERCPQVHYAVKADADVLLNLGNLVKMLMEPDVSRNNYLSGLVWYDNPVIRNPQNRFYLPYDIYPNPVYPPYPLGMCYIMSIDLPDKILQISKEIKPIYIEDAYIGLCLERLRIAPTNPPDLKQFVVNPPASYNRCYYSNVVAIITYSRDELVSFWTDIHKSGPPC